jgi:hypothetical protein
MPNTEFAAKLYFSGNTLSVQGSLETPDRNDKEATVFAFVTQQQAKPEDSSAKTVTVAGEARLESTPTGGGASGSAYAWTLQPPRPTIHPAATGWGFDTEMTTGSGTLSSGWAFGTAVLVTLQKDGSIETYAWSGWLKLVDTAETAAPESFGMGTPDPAP